MGFLSKLFGLPTRCPECGAEWAKDGLLSGVRCASPKCRNYDRAHAEKVFRNPIIMACPQCGADWARLESFDDVKCVSPNCEHYDSEYAGSGLQNPMAVEYVNFRDEQKTFTGDAASMRLGETHASMRVAPTGRRITLRLDRIRNRQEVEQAAPPVGGDMPSPREKRVLSYHQKRGTTSPLYESLRAKYPAF